MKLNACLVFARRELLRQWQLFAFYGFIFLCLLSVSTAILDAGMTLPDRVAAFMRKLDTDVVYVEVRDPAAFEAAVDAYPLVLADSSFDAPYILDTEALGFAASDDSAFGGVVYDKTALRSLTAEFLSDQMTEGYFAPEEGLAVWLSQETADAMSLCCGSKTTLYDPEQQPIATLSVQGIYPTDESRYAFYLSPAAVSAYQERCANAFFSLKVYPERFRDLFGVLRQLKDNQISCMYATDVVSSIQMLYIAFYASDCILLVALAGIFLHLLGLYLERRAVFFSVNAALGMSERDLLCIVFWILEGMLACVTLLALPCASLLLGGLYQYAKSHFELSTVGCLVPWKALLCNFGLLQCCFVVILARLRRRLKKREIIAQLRENQD